MAYSDDYNGGNQATGSKYAERAEQNDKILEAPGCFSTFCGQNRLNLPL